MMILKTIAALPVALVRKPIINRHQFLSTAVSQRLVIFSFIYFFKLTEFRIFCFFCSELKRRLKAEQKLKEKTEKAAQQPAPSEEKKSSKTEEEISPNEYYKLRTAAVAALKTGDKAEHPYPHKFTVTTSLEEFIEKYNNLSSGEVLENVTLSVAGRVHSIRESGAKLVFYDLRGEGVKIQVCN